MSTRLSVASGPPLERGSFAEDVEYYLSLIPRQLPSRYLYDALGSALFDAICELPWYGITRTERRLLREHAGEILSRGGPVGSLIELGPGNGDKLGILMDKIDAADAEAPSLTVHLVDVSPAALDVATRVVSSRPHVTVVPHATDYQAGLDQVASRAGRDGRAMALFLGSNIGNFDPPGAAMLLERIRATLWPGDTLLISTDLVKPERDLLLAYDDPLGVTAAFNRNLLVRANRELGADFDVDAFAHRAVWNAAERRVEMHLVSTRAQKVRLPASHLEITFTEGEIIWTESSYKYRQHDVCEFLAPAHFEVVTQWTADAFALTLARAVAMPRSSHA
jgi:dimethylhistidine N-methyltransferase